MGRRASICNGTHSLLPGWLQTASTQILASGRYDERPGLEACLKALRAEDTLVVWKLDRLGRHLRHLVTLVETLHQRDVGLKVVTGQGVQIDTTTANGRLVFGIFAALAEFEAELIRERTRAGLAAARIPGAAGRPAAQNDESRAAHGHGSHGGS